MELKKDIIFVRLELHLNYIIFMFTSFVAIKIDDYNILLRLLFLKKTQFKRERKNEIKDYRLILILSFVYVLKIYSVLYEF